MGVAAHYRLEDLRRAGAGLLSGVGVVPARASALMGHLLWYDAAGATNQGMRSLPQLLDSLSAGAPSPTEEGVVSRERNGTAVFDARGGIPLLALERAAGIAVEKSREAGVGLVRARNLGPLAAVGSVAAEIALGPAAAVLVGPAGGWAVALPSAGGLPAVHEPALAASAAKSGARPARAAIGATLPWGTLLAGDGGWLVLAYQITAQEDLDGFATRLAEVIVGLDEKDGRLLPEPWEARRRAIREHGLALPAATVTELNRRGEPLGLPPLEPMPTT